MRSVRRIPRGRADGLESGKINGHRFGIRLKYTHVRTYTYAHIRTVVGYNECTAPRVKRGRQIAVRAVNKVRKSRTTRRNLGTRTPARDASSIHDCLLLFLIFIRERLRERERERERAGIAVARDQCGRRESRSASQSEEGGREGGRRGEKRNEDDTTKKVVGR